MKIENIEDEDLKKLVIDGCNKSETFKSWISRLRKESAIRNEFRKVPNLIKKCQAKDIWFENFNSLGRYSLETEEYIIEAFCNMDYVSMQASIDTLKKVQALFLDDEKERLENAKNKAEDEYNVLMKSLNK